MSGDSYHGPKNLIYKRYQNPLRDCTLLITSIKTYLITSNGELLIKILQSWGPLICIWKHTILCIKGVFTNVHRSVILYIRWDTPSENTGLWQLLNASSVFKKFKPQGKSPYMRLLRPFKGGTSCHFGMSEETSRPSTSSTVHAHLQESRKHITYKWEAITKSKESQI